MQTMISTRAMLTDAARKTNMRHALIKPKSATSAREQTATGLLNRAAAADPRKTQE